MQLFGIPFGQRSVSATGSHAPQRPAKVPSKKERGFRTVEIANRFIDATFDMIAENIILKCGGIERIREQIRDKEHEGACCTIAASPDNTMLVATVYEQRLEKPSASLELSMAYHAEFLEAFRDRACNDDLPKVFVKGASKERAYQDMDCVYYGLVDVPTGYENVFMHVVVTLSKDQSDETIRLHGRLYAAEPLLLDFRGIPSMMRRVELQDESFEMRYRRNHDTLVRIITSAMEAKKDKFDIDYVTSCAEDTPSNESLHLSPDRTDDVLHDLFWFVGGLNRSGISFCTTREGSIWKYATVAKATLCPQQNRTLVKLLIR
jgi:hypothetical protein